MATTKPCANCGKDIPADSRFCPACGVPQAVACAACGHANAASSRFCAQCGGKLGEAAAAAPVAAPAPAAVGRPAGFRRAPPTHGDVLRSRRLDRISTRLDPEDLREVIAAYHRLAADVVTRFGGYVAQYLGDGVMVYFGYPEAHEDDAENAVRAALELADAMKRTLRRARPPSGARRHRYRPGRGRRACRRRRRAGAQGRRRDAEPRGAAAIGRRAEFGRDLRHHAAACRRIFRIRGDRAGTAQRLRRPGRAPCGCCASAR